MKSENTIFLIGFMGSGKTFWGSKLALRSRMPFYDLDSLMEDRYSNSITGLFTQLGESRFRLLEREILHDCQQLGTAIVATGGGTPCFFDNMEWMNRIGHSIYLKTPANILAARLKHQRDARPLLANVEANELESHIEILLEKRASYYAQASATVDYTPDDATFFDQLMRKVSSFTP